MNECNDVMLCFLRGFTTIKVYLILPQIQKTVTPYYIFGPYNSLPGIHNQIIVCFHIRATYYTISVCTITSQTQKNTFLLWGSFELTLNPKNADTVFAFCTKIDDTVVGWQ